MMMTMTDGDLLEVRLATPGRVARQPTVVHRPCRNLLADQVQVPTAGRPGLPLDLDTQAVRPMEACRVL